MNIALTLSKALYLAALICFVVALFIGAPFVTIGLVFVAAGLLTG